MFHKRSRFIAQWLLMLVTVTAVFLSGAASVNAAVASWGIVTSPNTSTTQNNELYGVSCTSSTSCVAVGYYNSGGYQQTLAEQYNGTGWNIVSSPNTSTSQNNGLTRVTCVTASDCWAVGDYYTGSYWQTLIEQWNGTSWSIVSSPDTSTTQTNVLDGVTCVSSSDCWAVGHSNNGSLNLTLVEQWNGSAWAIIASPSPGTGDNGLNGVTCVTASDCWAVGNYATTQYFNLALQYNGSSWSQVSTPSVSSTLNSLNDVSCVATSFCFAVGQQYTSGSYYETVTEEWNGTTWAVIASPNEGSGDNVPLSVTCVTASDCSAVGFYTSTSRQPLALGWNGTDWSIVSSASPSTSFTQLLSVACVMASDNCIAVGYYSTGSYDQTLIEQNFTTLTATVPVVAGTLSFVAPPANLGFSTVTLTGSNQTATATETLDIGDNTGSGSGWDVSVSNTPFTNGTQTLYNSDFTAASPPTPVCDSGVTCTPATWSGSVGYPYTLPGSTATKLLSAAAGTGMANQTVTIAWSASIPANTYAGTYTSTWTLTLASGP